MEIKSTTYQIDLLENMDKKNINVTKPKEIIKLQSISFSFLSSFRFYSK
jgi:hypothetical protein